MNVKGVMLEVLVGSFSFRVGERGGRVRLHFCVSACGTLEIEFGAVVSEGLGVQ